MIAMLKGRSLNNDKDLKEVNEQRNSWKPSSGLDYAVSIDILLNDKIFYVLIKFFPIIYKSKSEHEGHCDQ